MKLRDNKGITLIVLIITIIVLIVLAGITLTSILEEDGIWDQANSAALETEKNKVLEGLRLDVYNKQTSDIENEQSYLNYLISENKVDENGVIDVSVISGDIETGKGTKETGDVYYIKKGELYYLDEEMVETNLGLLFVERYAITEDVFEYSDEEKTILTGVKAENIQLTGEGYTEKGTSRDIIYNGRIVTEITIPSSVKKIDDNAFNSYVNLEKVNYAEGSTLEEIGSLAFACCFSLKTMNLPDTFTTKGYWAFYGTQL